MMARKKITIRPPGLKPTTKVGTLGPYRGRLGLAWVIAPVVVGILILVAGYLALTRQRGARPAVGPEHQRVSASACTSPPMRRR
jgi:hypothetical protein